MISAIVFSIFVFLTTSRHCKGSKNVLLVIADDARPALGSYGHKILVTPNLDQLATRAVQFDNAYSQQAQCGPSRTSFLTSRRPDTTKVIDVHHYWRTWAGNFTTLPQHFKENGYHTVSVGKVFHPGITSGKTYDYPYSWSQKPYLPSAEAYTKAKVCRGDHGKLEQDVVCPVNLTQMPLKTLPDIQSTQYAIKFLKDWKESQTKQRFFLAVGYHKPHIPLKYPEKYKDLYPLSEINLANHHTRPRKMPLVAWNPWTDLRKRDDVKQLNVTFPYGPLPEHYQRLMRQSYYASMTYIDDLIGQLLSTLDVQGFANDTIILMMSDHGWAMGENQEWCKYSVFEVATRVPLLVYVPGLTSSTSQPGTAFPYINPFHIKYKHTSETMKTNRLNTRYREKFKTYERDTFSSENKKLVDSAEFGTHVNGINYRKYRKYNDGLVKHTDALCELVDVFPTLADFAGIPVPPLCPPESSDTILCSEGISLGDVVRNVSRSSPVIWKRGVFSEYPRPSDVPQENSDQCRLEDVRVMGYTMRTALYRFTQWIGFDHVGFRGNWSDIHAQELYIHGDDPEEFNNVAGFTRYKPLVIQMSDWLRKGWRQALPPHIKL